MVAPREGADGLSAIVPMLPPEKLEKPDAEGRGDDAEEMSAGAEVVKPGAEVGPLLGDTRR